MTGAQSLIAWAILALVVCYLWPRTQGFTRFNPTEAIGCGALIFAVGLLFGGVFVWLSK